FTVYHSGVYTVYRIQFRDYALSYRAKPDKAGGWGCNPHTENTQTFYSISVRIRTKPIQTKRKRRTR
ncbi:MAG: hypothetical protein PHQ75_14735, partial [Thermoguttaceae bacterium]|nr:hypothetical protein [Thermoguttaceae bacterium]